MRTILTAIAIAMIVISSTIYLEPRPAQTTAARPAAELPAPFQVVTPTGKDKEYTPGDDFTKYVLEGKPTASMDAYRILERCHRQRKFDPDRQNTELAGACDGISPEMMARAPGLLAEALVLGGMPEAATELFWVLYPLSPEEIAKARENEVTSKALDLMVETLRQAAPTDRDSITALALLYNKDGIVKRDAAQALTYVTALQAIKPGHPGLMLSREAVVAELSRELTPEQVRTAKETGLALARSCNCRQQG